VTKFLVASFSSMLFYIVVPLKNNTFSCSSFKNSCDAADERHKKDSLAQQATFLLQKADIMICALYI